MRFHQAVTFLPIDDTIRLAQACDGLGYSGIYLSDHLFNPRVLESKYTYSTAPDGAPFWEKETEWPDPMCLISALSAVTSAGGMIMDLFFVTVLLPGRRLGSSAARCQSGVVLVSCGAPGSHYSSWR